jgi:hypothetical protein
MSAPRRTLAVVLSPSLSAFDRRRRDVAERATLELAAELTKYAAVGAAKAASLLSTASALPERREALRDGPDGWLEALRAAHRALGEVLGEVE